LLQSKAKLEEREEIQKFFKKRKQLSAFIGTYATNIGLADRLAYEFPLVGDFAADIMLGNQAKGIFCPIEFEDGKADSIFTTVPKKFTTEWSRRFEHGFSQLVDWFYSLDDFKKTERFANDFGHGHVTFSSWAGVPASRTPTETVSNGARRRSVSIHTPLNVSLSTTCINTWHGASVSSPRRRNMNNPAGMREAKVHAARFRGGIMAPQQASQPIARTTNQHPVSTQVLPPICAASRVGDLIV
jgi:hypothetical protein